MCLATVLPPPAARTGVAKVSKFTPTVHPITSSFQCGQYDTQQDELLMETLQQVKNHIQVHSSCESIYKANPSAASGYHQIQAINGSLVQVYCDMEGANCGGEGGWTRVEFVNMTKPGVTHQTFHQVDLEDLH